MNKNLVMVTVIAVLAVGLLAGCGRKVGKLSEADFIELNAQAMSIASTERDPEKLDSKLQALFDKYDMTMEEMNTISSGPDGNEMSQRLGPQIMKRAQELGFK
jgi:hypothetical protein